MTHRRIQPRKSGLPLNVLYSESAVLNAIGIATHHGAEIRVICFGIVQVGSATIIAKHDILGGSIFIWDEEIGKSGTIRYEARTDPRCRDCVFSEDT